MAKEEFRKQLKQEAKVWESENLISSEQYEQLSDRYQFDALVNSNQLFSSILYGLGGVLIGLAVITFVAANWQLITKPVKVILLLSMLSGVNILGFHLWQRVPSFFRLGQGLLLLGGLILGATIALVAQIFNLDGELYSLFFGWGFGVITMAGFIRFQPLAVLGLIITGSGYINYLSASYTREFDLIGYGMPLIAILLLPLSYWLGSRVTFTFTALLWLISTIDYLWEINHSLAVIIPFVILWGLNDALKIDRIGSYWTEQVMQPIGRVIALLLFAGELYYYSFKFTIYQNTDFIPEFGWAEQFYFGLFVGIAIYVIIAQILFLPGRREIMSKIVFGMAAVFLAVRFIDQFSNTYFQVYIVNCLLTVLSLGLIRDAIEQGKRKNLWFGVILLSLQIISRMFEYDTGLLSKAIALALCGVMILGLGIWFERYLHRITTEENV